MTPTLLDRIAWGLWTWLVALVALTLLVILLAEVGLVPPITGYEIAPPHFLFIGAGAIAAGIAAAVSMRRR